MSSAVWYVLGPRFESRLEHVLFSTILSSILSFVMWGAAILVEWLSHGQYVIFEMRINNKNLLNWAELKMKSYLLEVLRWGFSNRTLFIYANFPETKASCLFCNLFQTHHCTYHTFTFWVNNFKAINIRGSLIWRT